MLVVPTAKILLFIALNLGPHNPQTVYVTSPSESYVWTQNQKTGWGVTAKGFPTSDFTRDPDMTADLGAAPAKSSMPAYLRGLSHYNWDHDGIVVFDNGNRVEKRGKYGFFVINAGGPNEKTFTFLYPTPDDPETQVQKQEK